MLVTVDSLASEELVLATKDLKLKDLEIADSVDDNDSSSSASSDSSASTLESDPTELADSSTESGDKPRRRRSCLKSNFSVDDIPVTLDKKSFRCLPKPDMKQIKSIRSVSSESYFQKQQQETQPRRRGVSFADVTVREYDLTLGDHPCVSYGSPISLDWKFEEKHPMDLENFEADRQPQRRTQRQMVLSHYQRKNILLHTYGYSKQELQVAQRSVKTVQRQRAVTRYWLNLSKVEEAVESAGRKAKRAVTSNNNNKSAQ